MCAISLLKANGDVKSYFFANNFSVTIRDNKVEVNSYELSFKCRFESSEREDVISQLNKLHPNGYAQFKVDEFE